LKALLLAVWILPVAAFAQHAGQAIAPRTVVLDPERFAGREIVLVCTLSPADVMAGHCPAIDWLAGRIGVIIIDFTTADHANHLYVLNRCLGRDQPTCTVRVAGQIEVKDHGGLVLRNPRLKVP
jgi:hypothetical protein